MDSDVQNIIMHALHFIDSSRTGACKGLAMEVLARFNGRNGEITILEERASGRRLYHEAGVFQSYVLPGGSAALDYVRLMARVLAGASEVLLFGCGGGVLATDLHGTGSRVVVVDNNPISFEIARRYFWMPHGITCAVEDMASYLELETQRYPAIGVDVGGPCFDYEAVLDTRACAMLRRRLVDGGRIVVNIACDWTEDITPERIAACFLCEDLDVWICDEQARSGRNTVIIASDGSQDAKRFSEAASLLGFRPRRAA